MYATRIQTLGMDSFLHILAQRGTLLEPPAADYLSKLEDPLGHMERIAPNLDTRLFVSLEAILEATRIAQNAAAAAVTPPGPIAAPRSVARDLAPATDFAEDLTVLRDVTGNSTCEGTLQDFTRMFRHRLETIGAILRRRREFRGAVTLSKAKSLMREFATIVLVTDIRTTRNGNRMLIVEDDTAQANVIVLRDLPAFQEPVLQDEVIGLVARGTDRGLILAEALFRPGVPNGRAPPTIPEAFCIGFMSDIHVGSRTFLEERWGKFADWIRSDAPLARGMKYLVLSGDVVDGIGVYPRQDRELLIDDIYAQYEDLARRLGALPDHLRVIMLPGNHDAVRPAEPQPTFPQEIQKLFDSNVTFVGNPCTFRLHGLKVLAYHGRSMDDWVSAYPGGSYHRPLDIMRAMLDRRHLAPMYGAKTPIAPEERDYLLIEDVPDIFVTGHVHNVGADTYRGVYIVNSSTWQAQTAFQKMHNVEPAPANLPILNVHSGRFTVKAF